MKFQQAVSQITVELKFQYDVVLVRYKIAIICFTD